MMKKLLVLLLVLGLSGVASAVPCALQLIAPAPGAPGSSAHPLAAFETLRVYIETDSSGLGQLVVTITLTGNGQITGGILLSEAASYGAQVTDSGVVLVWAGGWQSGLSFNTAITPTTADIGLGHFQSTIWGPTTLPPVVPVNPGDLGGGNAVANTPIAYFDIECFGPGDLTLTMTGPLTLMDDGLTPVTDFGSPITIYQVPEPMTIALLALGSLALLKKRR
ncbi:MAG: PEP-CTERM sorting domain-containing protein [Planctomycetota bacterium]|jgi:hypothetical protein